MQFISHVIPSCIFANSCMIHRQHSDSARLGLTQQRTIWTSNILMHVNGPFIVIATSLIAETAYRFAYTLFDSIFWHSRMNRFDGNLSICWFFFFVFAFRSNDEDVLLRKWILHSSLNALVRGNGARGGGSLSCHSTRLTFEWLSIFSLIIVESNYFGIPFEC